jgi:hypothetical protein
MELDLIFMDAKFLDLLGEDPTESARKSLIANAP